MADRRHRREPTFDSEFSSPDFENNYDHGGETSYQFGDQKQFWHPARSLPVIILMMVIVAFVTNALYLQHGNRTTVISDTISSLKRLTLGSTANDASAIPSPPRRPDGSFGDVTIASAERALSQIGYFSGIADGTKSAAFREALIKFQKDRKLPATGELDEVSRRELEKVSGRLID